MAVREIDVVLPVHNEASSIEGTLKEFNEVARKEGFAPRFVVSEDGSSDGTPEVLASLAADLPIDLISEPTRKGYSRAVVDGARKVSAPWALFIDSDGQCDPRDLPRLARSAEDTDLVIGYRSPRKDSWARLLMSKAFHFVYRRLFPVRLRDPSCPYVLIRKEKLETLLHDDLGVLAQGFWWEFMARATGHGFKIAEVPISHRIRSQGETQVYVLKKIPSIAVSHLRGLWILRKQIHNG